jgi:hypothetical protein
MYIDLRGQDIASIVADLRVCFGPCYSAEGDLATYPLFLQHLIEIKKLSKPVKTKETARNAMISFTRTLMEPYYQARRESIPETTEKTDKSIGQDLP